VYVSGVDSSIVVPAKGKVQAGGSLAGASGVEVMVGTLVTVGGSRVNVGDVAVAVTSEVTVTWEQAARRRKKRRRRVCFIFIENSFGSPRLRPHSTSTHR
jgi:hypothetical protein